MPGLPIEFMSLRKAANARVMGPASLSWRLRGSRTTRPFFDVDEATTDEGSSVPEAEEFSEQIPLSPI